MLFTAIQLTLGAIFVWWVSNVIYSIYFSPLKDIPSPLIFQLFPIYNNILKAFGTSHHVIHQYHLQLGPVFRVGWNYVLFVDHEAATKIFGSHKFLKGDLYNGFQYYDETLLSTRDAKVHSKRKRLMAPAFTKAQTLSMEPIVIKDGVLPLHKVMTDALALKQTTGEYGVVDLYKLYNCLTWDVMGSLAYGESFNMIPEGDHPAIHWMIGLSRYYMVIHLVPMLRVFKSRAGEKLRKFLDPALSRYYKKHEKLPNLNNLIGRFIEAKDPQTDLPGLNRSQVFAEAHLMLFGGTDSTSNTLTWVTHMLMTKPKVYDQVMLEIQNLVKAKHIQTGAALEDLLLSYDECKASLPYLQAVIKETMRLIPSIPGTPPRLSPPEGATVLGHYLPGGTLCSVPIHSLHNSPQLWEEPDQFNPDRWLDDLSDLANVESVKNYMPFLLGPRSCIGKNLAMMELVLVVANLLVHYKLELVDESDIVTVALPSLRPIDSTMLVRVTPSPIHI